MKQRFLVIFSATCLISLMCSCAGPEKSSLFQFPLGKHETKELHFSNEENTVQIEVTERIFGMRNFDYVTHPIIISPNGRNFAHGALNEKASRTTCVVLNGNILDEYADGVLQVVFSPDSRRYFYNVKTGVKIFPVLDGKEFFPAGFQFVRGLEFTPDSRSVVCHGIKTGQKDTEKYILFNGKEYGPYIDVQAQVLSPDSKRIAVVDHASTDTGDTYSIYLDGNKIGTYEILMKNHIEFTEDSGKLTYFYMEDSKWYFKMGNEKYGPYDNVRRSFQCLAKDSRSFVYCAQRKKGWYVVTRDNEYGPYEEKLGAIISADGGKVGYTAKKNGRYYVYVNGESKGETSKGDRVFICEDGSFLYTLTEGKNKNIYRDGKLIHELTFEKATDIWLIEYEEDAGVFALLWDKDGMRLFVNGEENRTYLYIGHFISDGRGNYAYWAKISANNHIFVINGIETLRSNRSTFPIALGEDGRLYGALIYTNPYLTPTEGGPAARWAKEIENMRLKLFEIDIKK